MQSNNLFYIHHSLNGIMVSKTIKHNYILEIVNYYIGKTQYNDIIYIGIQKYSPSMLIPFFSIMELFKIWYLYTVRPFKKNVEIVLYYLRCVLWRYELPLFKYDHFWLLWIIYNRSFFWKCWRFKIKIRTCCLRNLTLCSNCSEDEISMVMGL